MKKFLFSLLSICLCAVCAFSLVGCKKDLSKTTTDTTNVTANGGSSVIYNNYLYFTNGVVKNDGKKNGGTMGSIYKVELQADGTIAEDATYTKVVDSLVGYEKGSINIIGDFLYYTTAGTGKNKSGEVLYSKTKFMRYDLKNDQTQQIYVTADNNADEAVTFAYYKTGSDYSKLNLVVYEATSKTLKSFAICDEITEVFSKSEVQSAVLSENMGVGKTADSAEKYVFYTLNCEKDAINQNTNRAYKITADGNEDTLINDNANLKLEGIFANKLLVSATFTLSSSTVENTYAFEVTSQTKNGDLKVADPINSKNPHIESDRYIVSRNSYDNSMYIEEVDGSIGLLYVHNKTLRYSKYNGGTEPAVDLDIFTFDNVSNFKFIGSFKDDKDSNNTYVVLSNSTNSKNTVYKIRVNFANQDDVDAEKPDITKLSTTNIVLTQSTDSSSSDSKDLGNMMPKLINKYVYVFAQDEDKNILLHRVNVYTPEEVAEQNPPVEEPGDGEEEGEDKLEVGEAELIGGPEI